MEDQIGDEIQQMRIDEELRQVNPAQVRISQYGQKILVSIQPDDNKSRVPIDVVCVIDISGSMDEEAAVKNEQGQKEMHGLTKLDILKHAVKTTIMTLSDDDRFGLVTFSDDARTEYPMEFMTREEKERASQILEKLETEGSTNLWAGLKKGLDVMKLDHQSEARHASIILLTDGEPNILPTKSHQYHLQSYLNAEPGLRVSLQTFAFGKQTDSVLLRDLARVGHGDYSFIPCPGFIGTIFVNTLSNLMSTLAVNTRVSVQPLNGARIKTNSQFAQGGGESSLLINLEDIKFGQSRDCVFEVVAPPHSKERAAFSVQVEYHDFVNKKTQKITSEDYVLSDQLVDPMAEVVYWKQEMNNRVVEAVKAYLKSKYLPPSQDIIKELSVNMRKSCENLRGEEERLEQCKEYLLRILKDVEGEITLSFLKVEWFTQWGQHYLPSLMNAHMKQICNNFKDPGIQKYGGRVFQEIKDRAEEIFLNLPPPVTTQKKRKEEFDAQQNPHSHHQAQQQKQQPPQNQPRQSMQVYYDAGGGCFAPECLVRMVDGSLRQIQLLRGGDRLENGARVRKLVRVTNNQDQMMLCALPGGLRITPQHPIQQADGKWVKPSSLTNPELQSCKEVYNLILDLHHWANVNGVICVTLGHNLRGENVEHPYFGSSRIISDLLSKEQDQNNHVQGLITISNKDFVRNPLNQNQVCGIN